VTRFGNEAVVCGLRWSSVSVAMKARDQKPARRQVRGVVEELGGLVEDLGLVDPSATPATPPDSAAPTSPTLAAPPPPSAPVWRSGPEVITGSAASELHPHSAPPPPMPVPDEGDDELDAVPMWESAAAEPPITAVEAVPPTALWETFSPELAARPVRPWSPAAAMVALEPIAPPDAPHAAPAKAPSAPLWQRRPHAFTLLTAVAMLVALAVFAFSRLDLGHTTGPARPVAGPAFVLDTLRTVAAGSPAQVPSAKLLRSFPASATAIYLDVTYRNVTPSDTLQIVILLQPAHPGQPAVTVSDETHRNLPSGGEIAVTVEAPPGGFTPGTYEVRALHDGTLEQSTTFQIRQP
jgi:hypothetical protein